MTEEEAQGYIDKLRAGQRQGKDAFDAPPGSGDWAPILVTAIVKNCRQQISTLRMKMPLNVALALGRADEELADCEAWIRADRANCQNSEVSDRSGSDQ